MRDEVGASFVLMVGAAAIGYWWYRQPQTRQEALLGLSGGGGASTTTPPGGGAASATTAPLAGISAGGMTPLDRLLGFARGEGLPVTSHEDTAGIPTGGHVPGSLHYQGRAIDVGVGGLSFAQISQVVNDAVAGGFRVLTELYTGNGPYGYSSGPHLHIEDRRP